MNDSKTEKYLRRSAKYFAMLCVLFSAVTAALYATGNAAVPFGELAGSWRGRSAAAIALLLAALYPSFGFVVREIEGDFQAGRARIDALMNAQGFVVETATPERSTFRAARFLRRASLMFEDEIRISAGSGGTIRIEGIRKAAVRAASGLESYLKNDIR